MHIPHWKHIAFLFLFVCSLYTKALCLDIPYTLKEAKNAINAGNYAKSDSLVNLIQKSNQIKNEVYENQIDYYYLSGAIDFFYHKNYSEALKNINISLEIALKNKDHVKEKNILFFAGILMMQIDDKIAAQSYMEMGRNKINFLKQIHNIDTNSTSDILDLCNLLSIYLIQEDTVKAKQLIEEEGFLTTKVKHQLLFNELGIYYSMQNKLDTAIHYFKLALKHTPKESYNDNKHKNLFNIGELYYRLNENELALQYLDSSFVIAKQKKDHALIKDKLATILYHCYYREKNYEKANEFIQILDSIDIKIPAEEIKKIMAEKEHTDALLQKKSYKLKIFLFALIALLLFAYILYYIHNKQYENTNETIPYAVSEEVEKKILDYLSKFEKTNAFLESKLLLDKLSSDVNINKKYISSVIIKYKNVPSFTQYLNKLRINYIKKELKTNPKLVHYTIEALALEAGFNSKKPFIEAFKKYTSLTPDEFIKNL